MGDTLAPMVVGSGGQHGQEGPTASRPTFRLIQILRALAALMVVAHHTTIMLNQRNQLPIGNWLNGASGVDIFFVISGFVMTISTAPLQSKRTPHPARTFLARRVERVVPMYWLVTTVKVVVLLLVPALGLNGLGSASHVAGSYLFWPSYNPEHAIEPVVVVGWTLNYEMAFYLLFALALAWRRRPLWVVAPPLLAFAVWRLTHILRGPVWLDFYMNTMLLEFLFGMLLGLALPWVRRVPWPLGLLLVVGGLVPLFFWRDPVVAIGRGLSWGVPALAVVAGALIMESRWGARSPRWMLELGDASYSIYLIHTFALPAVGLLLTRFHHPWQGEVAVSLAGAVVLSTLAGELAYRLIERPMTAWFKGRRRTAVPVMS